MKKTVTVVANVQVTVIHKDVEGEFSKESAKEKLINDLKDLGYDDVVVKDIKKFEMERPEKKVKKCTFGRRKKNDEQ